LAFDPQDRRGELIRGRGPEGWPAADTAGRESLWQAVNVLGKVRDHLARIVADGKLAQRELSDLVHKP
jgi:hypothetical protein